MMMLAVCHVNRAILPHASASESDIFAGIETARAGVLTAVAAVSGFCSGCMLCGIIKKDSFHLYSNLQCTLIPVV